MKIISALYNKICMLECSCCGDTHYAEFAIPTKKFLDENNFLIINFKTSEYRLRDRIRISKDILLRRKFLKNKTEIINSLIVDYNQLGELFSLLKLEFEQNDLLKPEDIKNEKKVLELLTSSDDKFQEYSIFTSKDDCLIVSISLEKNTVDNINIGYALNETYFLNLLSRCITWIFNKKRNYIFEEYEVCLSKEDFINLMNSLNWILENVEEKKTSSNPFTHLELKNIYSMGNEKCK